MAKEIKDLIIGDDARKSLSKGISKVVAAVGTTLGPKGQNVLIDSGHPAAPSAITKDGVTVLRNLVLSDPVENLAVKTIRGAAEKTVDECGDGTTTTAIIAGAIYTKGLSHLASGANPVMIKRGIDKVVNALATSLDNIKRDIKTDADIRNVATISANGDEEIGSLIVQAMDKVGQKGVVTVENGKSMRTELVTTDGMKIDRGYVSAYFMTNPTKATAELLKPLILVTDYEFRTSKDVIPFLEMGVAKSRPILILADGGTAEALQTMVVNKMKGSVSCCAVDAPGFGDRKKEYLKDIAALVGAEFVSNDVGISLEDAGKTIELLGTCEKVIVSKHDTTFVNANSKEDVLANRIAELESQLAAADNDYDREFLKERIAKLTGKIAVILVGGSSEVEVEEKKDRIDDALGATKAAIEGGIVVGGGCAFIHAAQKVDMKDLNIKNTDEAAGVSIMLDAIKQPVIHIVENAGKSGTYIAETVLQNCEENETFGYNVVTEAFGDMFEMGIIDPVKVAKSALINASSVATLLLTSKTIIMKQNQVRAVRG